MRVIVAAAGLMLGLQAAAALACGHCVEDKIAAVYDHGAAARAFSQKHHVAYFAIDGVLAPGDATRRAIEALAESAQGVDKGSARVSVESASLSVAFDPQRVSLAAVQRAIESKLSSRRLSLANLRVIDKPAGADLAVRR